MSNTTEGPIYLSTTTGQRLKLLFIVPLLWLFVMPGACLLWLLSGLKSSALAVILSCLAVVIAFVSCATDTGIPAKDQRGRVTNAVATEAAKVAWSFLLNSGENYLRGQNGQDAAGAAFGAALRGYDGAAGLANIIDAAAGPQAASVAKAAYVAAEPKTPEQKVAVANSIGAAFQQAANALARK